MKLSQKDVALFYRLNTPLLFHVNKHIGMIQNISTLDEFKELPLEEKIEVRDALYENIELIDSFVKENPAGLSPEDLDIVNSWRDFVKGTFYVFRYLKSHTIFLDSASPPKAYGVLGITDSIDEIFNGVAPIMVKTTLLPFKGRIIYDGVMHAPPILFGGGIRRSMNDSYREAKAQFGVITSLPFSGEERSDADKLKALLRTESSREMHWEEIERLISKSDELLIVYHQEMGKVHARAYRKRLKELELSGLWFGILDGIIIASGATKLKIERTLEEILRKKKRDLVYIFQLPE